MKAGAHDLDRFDRMKRIAWLDMQKIHASRCLVVGAGALGNEAVKCMVLAGFEDITIIDMDDIAVSNLSRCVFFREVDGKGMMKADILARRASELDHEVNITPIVSKVQELEKWDYDVILGCLDNISARLHVNSHAMFNNIPYIDGATDGFRGKVQVIIPDGPCLECTMNKSHMKVLDTRFSCTGNGMMFVPKTASEITTTSIIAAAQVREAMKLLSGRVDLCISNVMYYNGETGIMENLEIAIDPECPNHTMKE
ncbi:MAG: ThiF family adenylyltransferase [Candidatus Methanomethylophilaceae archaeon]|nr:ThiF family adenylyltransferase [Candidatus Methanomethylophilaceae archaeon]